ncbi:MAG: hypothetical protein WCJ02_01710 [bacterium]
MLSKTKQIGMIWMLSVGAAVMLCAQQRITPSEAARLQRQLSKEMRELQTQTDNSQRESRHIVREAAVVEIEAQKAQESKRENKAVVKKANVNPRSPEEKAKIDAALKEFNARLPQINASLKKASTNSAMPRIALKPMTADEVLSSSGGKSGPGKTMEQQAINQAINQRLQEEMKKMDPQTRNQMKSVLKAAEQGKTIPLPKNMPPEPRSQLLPKGSP